MYAKIMAHACDHVQRFYGNCRTLFMTLFKTSIIKKLYLSVSNKEILQLSLVKLK